MDKVDQKDQVEKKDQANKSETPMVSIVVPLYNAEEYIKTCLDSIIGQTFEDFEVVVVNDCSTDKSVEIVESYDDPRIKLVQKKSNSGDAATRNIGITNARGKYVYFVDDDDALMPQTLETLVTATEESQADLVLMNGRYETRDANFVFNSNVKIKKIMSPNHQPRFFSDNIVERFNQEYFSRYTHWEPWMKLQRRDFLLEHQIFFPKTWVTTDRLFYLAQLCFARKVQVIDFVGYVYRRHDNQTVHSALDKAMRKNILSMPSAVEFINALFDQEPIEKEDRESLIARALLDYFECTVQVQYRRMDSKEQFDDILREVVPEEENLIQSDFVIAMFKILASSINENNLNRARVQSMKKNVNQRWIDGLGQLIKNMKDDV